MPGAIIALDQDRPSGSSPGTPGVARNDGWVGRTVRPTSTQTGNASQEWTLLAAPPGSTAFISSPSSVTCAFTPDLPGTYRVQLITNGGGTGNVQILVIRCRYDVNGTLVNRGWALPGFGETAPESNYPGNEEGWDEPFEFIVADLLANAFGGGGGGTSVEDNARAARAGAAGAMRSIGVTTALSPAAMLSEVTGLGRVDSWVSGPATVAALALGFADGTFVCLDALTMSPTNAGSVTGGGPVHVYCTGGKAVFVGATGAKIEEINGAASPVSISSPSNFGGYAVTIPGTGNTEILLITSPADNTIYYYNLTSGGVVGVSYVGAAGSTPTGICVDNEGNVWVNFTTSGTVSTATLVKFTNNGSGVLVPASVSVTGFLCNTNIVFDGRYIWGVYSNGTNAVLNKVRVADHTLYNTTLTTNGSTRSSVLFDGELIVVSTTNALIKVHPDTFEQKVMQAVASADLGALTLSADGKALFYSSMVSSTPGFVKYKTPLVVELDRAAITNISANKLLYTNANAEVVALPGGTNGQVPMLVGGVPTWSTLPPGFTAGGDLSGSSTSQNVIGFDGTALDTSMSGPADGDFIQKLSGKWHAITTAVAAVALIGASVGNTPTTGQILTATGTNTATWQPAPVSFTAGGDLSGTSTSQTVDSISGTSPIIIANASVLEWAASVASPTLKQAGQTSNIATNNLYIIPQAPYSGATGSNQNVGDVIVDFPAAVGSGTSGQFQWQSNGVTYSYVDMSNNGRIVAANATGNGYAAIGNIGTSGVMWVLGASSSINGSNWALFGDGTNLYINTAGGSGTIFFYEDNSTQLASLSSTAFSVNSLGGHGAGYATISNSGTFGFTSSIPVAAGSAGQVFITNSGPAAVWTSLITVELTHGRFTSGGTGSDYLAVMGPVPGAETTYAGFWLLPHSSPTPTSANPVLYSDGTNVNLNALSSSLPIWFTGGASAVYGQIAPTNFYIGGYTTAAPFYFDWSTATTPVIAAGTSSTSLRIGTNNGSAVLDLMADAFLTATSFQKGTGTQMRMDFYSQNGTSQSHLTHDNGSIATWTFGTSFMYLVNYAAEVVLSSGLQLYSNAISLEDYNGTYQWNLTPGSSYGLQFSPNLAATFSQATQTSDIATNNITFQTQAPYSGAVTNVNAGNFIFNVPASISGTPFGLGIVYQYAGVEQVRFGNYSGGGYGSIWFQAAGSPTTTNWAFLGNSASTYFNAPSTSGAVYFGLGTNYFLALNGSSLQFNIGIYTGSYGVAFDIDTFSPKMHIMAGNTADYAIVYDAQSTDTLPHNIKIQSQYAYSGASGANRTSGSVLFDYGPPTNSSTTEAYVTITRNGSAVSQIGVNKVSNAQAQLWLGTSAFTDSNAILAADGSTYAYFNLANGTSAFGLLSADANYLLYMPTTQNAFYFGGAFTSTASVVVNWATSTTPVIQGGTAATSLTFGTNKASATTLFTAGANSQTMSLSTTQIAFQSAGTTYSYVDLNNGGRIVASNAAGSGWVAIGANSGTSGYVWVLGSSSSLNSSSYAFLGDGTNLYINTVSTGGTIYLYQGNSNLMAQFATSLATIYTAATIGSTTGINTLKGGLNTSWRDSSSNFTIDSSTTDQQVHITATQSVAMIAPVKGRQVWFLIDATGGSAITLTLTQHSSENINGVANSWSYTFPAGYLGKWLLQTDGTNYFFT